MVLVYFYGGDVEDKNVLFRQLKKTTHKHIEELKVKSWPNEFPKGNIHEWRKICSDHYNEVKPYLEGSPDKMWVMFNSIIDILTHASRFDEAEFKRLIEPDDVRALIQNCQSSPVFLFQRASPKDGNNFEWLLDWLYIPFMKVCHSSKTKDLMADVFKRYKIPLDTSRFNKKKFKPGEKRTSLLFYKPRRKKEDRVTIRSINFTSENEYVNDWVIFPQGHTNRFIAKYPSAHDKLVQMYFHVGVRSEIVQRMLQDGVTVNGFEFSFLGCSSEGLKLRKCLMWKGNEREIRSIIKECGNFPENSVSKRMARFGLLFSELMLTNIEITNEMLITEDDVESDCRRYNFTDGCGSISLTLARRVTKEINRIKDTNINIERPPSVFKIRLHGYKGVLALEKTLESERIKVRPSMKKFHTTSLPSLGICDYSKPFTYGNLNRQYVTLLSGLGVPDEVFEKLQKSHYDMVSQMCCDAGSAIRILQWRKKSDVAAEIIDLLETQILSFDLTETDRVAVLTDSEQEQMKTKIKDLKKALRTEQADLAITKTKKIKALVPKSRYIFGVCDPYGILEYGECFIRVTTANHINNIRGPVVICKPPCYLKGDIRVLKAMTVVDKPDLDRLNHLVDCIVFPIIGPRPHPNEIAGSDLDGDKFFVSWESSLVPPTIVAPYDYPAAETPPDGAPTVEKLIRYFSTQNKAQKMTGKVDKYYRIWSDIEGANSEKCEQLAMRFSRVIDAAKTGASSKLPESLKPPDIDDSHMTLTFIWNKLEKSGKDFREKFQDGLISKFIENEIAVDKDLVEEIISDKASKLREFDKFRIAWLYAEKSEEEGPIIDQFIYWYGGYINFSRFTQEEKRKALEYGIPEHILVNALNMSYLLTEEEVSAFSLHSGDTPWTFYFRKHSSNMDWSMLTKALTSYDNACIVIGLPNEMILVIQFYYKLVQGLDQEIYPGTISTIFFSRHFGYKYRHIIGSDYQLDFTNDILQIYRNKNLAQSFVWLKTSNVKRAKGQCLDYEENINCLSVDLSRFNKQINQNNRPHPLLTKTQLSTVEIFVRNESCDAYYDVIEAEGDFPCIIDTELEDKPEEEYDGDLLALMEQPNEAETRESTADTHRTDSTERIKKNLLLASKHCNFNQIEAVLTYIKLHDVDYDLYHCLVTFLKSLIRKTTARVVPVELQSRLKSMNMNLPSTLTIKQKIEVAELLNRMSLNELAKHYLKMNENEATVKNFLQIIQSWHLFWYMDAVEAVQYLDGITKLTLNGLEQVTEETTKLQYIVQFGRLHCLDLIYCLKRLNTQLESNPLQTATTACVMNLKLDKSANSKEFKRIDLYASKALTYIPRIYLGQYVLVCRQMDTTKGIKCTRFTFLGKVVDVINAPFSAQIELWEPVPDVIMRSMNSDRRYLWKIHVVANIVTYLRVVDALKVLSNNMKVNNIAPLFSVLAESKRFSALEAEGEDIVIKETPLQPGGSVLALHECEENGSLDHSQKTAVRTALTSQITCITGPPGTGKSKVLCDIVSQVIKAKRHNKVLVVAETNNAVDNLARQLRQTNLIVRIGPLAGVALDLFDITLEGQVKQIASEIVEREKTKDKSGICVRNVELCHRIIDNSSVVMATCSTVADPILKEYRFDFVLVDEASTVLETTLLCSLVQGCKQLVLIGDHMQLSPFLYQQITEIYSHDGLPAVTSLSKTLFHRLTEKTSNIPTICLLVQYRMNERLLTFPSNEFYGGCLECCESVKKILPVPFIWPDNSTPICFIHTTGRDERSGSSFFNKTEAKLVSDVVNKLLHVTDEASTFVNKLSIKQISVLTFYQAQVKCIKDQLRDRVAVNTVDGFQGCENDVIVASTVRANGTIGFSGERNRLNVLFTRAKRGLVVIGDQRTLSKSELWSKWLNFAPKLEEGEVKIPVNKSTHIKQKYGKPHTDTVVGRKARLHVKH